MAKKASTSKIGVELKAPKPVAKLLVFAQRVHDNMAAASKELPSPSPALSVLQTDIDTLAAKEQIVTTHAPGAAQDRDAALKVLKIDLNNERAYVELVVNANPALAASLVPSVGMSLRSTPPRTRAPLAVKAGAVSGVVQLVAQKAQGAKANEWQVSLDGGKTWVDLPSTTKASTTVSNLTAGTAAQFRQRAVTKNGVSDWSLPVPHLVA
jgi:hypothetical protein